MTPMTTTLPKLTAYLRALTMSMVLVVISLASLNRAHSAWFERLIPEGETYSVSEIDRDVAFVIDGYIYDARKFCYMAVGDRVVFFAGRHGIDYRATVYNLDSSERCEVLLRGRR